MENERMNKKSYIACRIFNKSAVIIIIYALTLKLRLSYFVQFLARKLMTAIEISIFIDNKPVPFCWTWNGPKAISLILTQLCVSNCYICFHLLVLCANTNKRYKVGERTNDCQQLTCSLAARSRNWIRRFIENFYPRGIIHALILAK